MYFIIFMFFTYQTQNDLINRYRLFGKRRDGISSLIQLMITLKYFGLF